MITKKLFLEAIEKLNVIFPDRPLSTDAAKVYYDTLSADFDDKTFTEQLNRVLKESFKFPPIAAFYKGQESMTHYEPVYRNAEEEAMYKRAAERIRNGS